MSWWWIGARDEPRLDIHRRDLPRGADRASRQQLDEAEDAVMPRWPKRPVTKEEAESGLDAMLEKIVRLLQSLQEKRYDESS